eukprot:CAMPEP_0197664714 /NCGR_PEP_ID=MMETSP1338-20131121/58802_1 /TAXON_ID=43686 ORGANISM="Pelagodinium beii, Strain RCC1491" /NCGR_SAMPLE_ID=MMETSP1338 /ASSEMBLY_ACC=CAM_ASM_000754 /LENGTH=588 /DNA_ID=CAMNT_0043243409 /DNA_START=122 /DNA_END=1884 /DNA_ORIENTATION=-
MRSGSLRGSILTLMSAAIGSGVLLLPYAFSLVGLPMGLLCLLFGTYCLATSLRLIMTISRLTGCDSYAKSAAVVLGPGMAKALACIMVGESLCAQASYMKFLVELMRQVLPCHGFSQAQLTGIVVCLAFPAAVSRDLSALRHVTVVSLISLLFVACLIVAGALGVGSSESYSELEAAEAARVLHFGRGQRLWDLPRAWSIVLNALCCQHVAIPVYKQLHNSDIRRINKVLLRSCSSLSVLYALVACSGLVTYGRKTPENILMAFPLGHRPALLAQVLMGCSLLVAMPLNLHPARDQLPEVFECLQSVCCRLHNVILWPLCLCLRLATAARTLPSRRHDRPNFKEAISDRAASNQVRFALGEDKLRVLQTAGLMLVPAVMAVNVPTVTALVGIATGFGSVLWTFVMPVVMVYTLRRRAANAECSDGRGSRRPDLDRLLSSPLASPPWSRGSSVGSSMPGSPASEPAIFESLEEDESPRWGWCKHGSVNGDVYRSRLLTDSSSFSEFSRCDATRSDVVEEVVVRLVELQMEQESASSHDLHVLQTHPKAHGPGSEMASRPSSTSVCSQDRGPGLHCSPRFLFGVLALALG